MVRNNKIIEKVKIDYKLVKIYYEGELVIILKIILKVFNSLKKLYKFKKDKIKKYFNFFKFNNVFKDELEYFVC